MAAKWEENDYSNDSRYYRNKWYKKYACKRSKIDNILFLAVDVIILC
jgi:hypothetical protein